MWGSITRRLGKWTAVVVASVIAFTLGVVVGLIPSGASTEAGTTTVRESSTATVTTEGETVTIDPTKEQRQKLAERADQLDERAASVRQRASAVRQDEKRIDRMLGVIRRTSFNDGTFLVGREIRPGIYRAKNPGGLCYWARLSGLGGGFNDIIANENPSGQATVQIYSSDKAFQSTRCGTWRKVG
jgi:hypothetical protein